MTKETWDMIKESTSGELEFANKILSGDSDNYDGADGARTVRNLCKTIEILLKEIVPV